MTARVIANRGFILERVLERPNNGDTVGPSASYNECFFYGIANGKVYFAAGISKWHTAPYYVYSYEPGGAGLVTIATLTGGVAWCSAPDYLNNRIYIAGEEPGDNGVNYRMMAGYIDLIDDSFHHYWKPQTADCNEIIGVGLDTERGRLLVGERTSGGASTGSIWTGGHRVWSIPLATIDDPATWVMEWQNPDDGTIANPLVTYRDEVFLFQGGGKLKKASADDLSAWTTIEEADASGLYYSPFHDAVFWVVAPWNAGSYTLKKWDGSTLSSVTIADYGPNADNLIKDFGNGRLLIGASGLTRGSDFGSALYGLNIVEPATGALEVLTKMKRRTFASRGAMEKLGNDFYFCSVNPGGLWRLRKRT